MNRRHLFNRLAGSLGLTQMLAAAQTDPWPAEALLQPADLAKRIQSGTAPAILCVAFPVLYRQRHIAGAVYAGPGNKPDGLQLLETVAKKLSKDAEVVLYCGCCPMQNCPNIRPSYELLKQAGFKSIRVLEIPTNMNADWNSKGYPAEPPAPPREG